MRIRAVAIVIKNNQLLVLFRRKDGKEYFTFPGGGVESGENIEDAAIRELKEETSIEAKIKKLLYHHIYDDDTEHYFYLCDYMSGIPKLGDNSEEKIRNLSGNFYEPRFVNIDNLKNLLLYPLEIRDWLIEDLKNDFKNCPKVASLKVSELRENI